MYGMDQFDPQICRDRRAGTSSAADLKGISRQRSSADSTARAKVRGQTARNERSESTVSSQKVIISLLSSDLMQPTRKHPIEDLNPVERSNTKYYESYPRYHMSYPSLAALNATYHHGSHHCRQQQNQRSATIANEGTFEGPRNWTWRSRL
jgi:hypothetical protein